MPRTGAGEQESGGENVLSVARECRGILSPFFFARGLTCKEVEIPTIAVFTKSDLLVNNTTKRQGSRRF